jgi:hypothetical protein
MSKDGASQVSLSSTNSKRILKKCSICGKEEGQNWLRHWRDNHPNEVVRALEPGEVARYPRDIQVPGAPDAEIESCRSVIIKVENSFTRSSKQRKRSPLECHSEANKRQKIGHDS